MPRFGYTPETAEQVRNGLDQDLSWIEFRVRKVKETVPGAGEIALRLEEALEPIRTEVDALHDLVESRTEKEVPA